MKAKLVLLLFFLLIKELAFCQNTKLQEADQLFKDFAYMAAIQKYEELARGGLMTEHVCQQLAEAYRRIGNTEQSEYWYFSLIQMGASDPLNYYYYAQALKSNKKYTEADKWIAKFTKLNASDTRMKREIQEKKTKNIMIADSNLVEISKLTINSPNNDFSPAYYKDNSVIFASSREQSAMVSRTYVWDNQPFIDLYVCDRNLNNQLSNPFPFSREINSAFHEGPVSFYSQGNILYFTRNNYKNNKLIKSRDKTTNLKVYSAQLFGTVWGNIKEFPYNSNEYSTGHPSLTPDGKKMYFASDMPGGYGQADIYYTLFENGTWSTPINLGPQINTEGNEMFPFTYRDSIMYFASDGLPGFGGLDLYSAIKDTRGNYVLVNLGFPMNSPKDDFGMIIDDDLQRGYLSSNRKGGEGFDDIYSFTVSSNLWMLDELQQEMLKSDTIPADSIALLSSLNPNMNKRDSISFNGKKVTIGQSIVLRNIYYDLDKWNIRPDAAAELNRVIKLMFEYPTLVIELGSHTDSRATFQYNMDLSQKRAKSATEYITNIGGVESSRIIYRGYGETKLINKCADGISCKEEDHQMNRRTEITILKY